jgi:hypothetical protein
MEFKKHNWVRYGSKIPDKIVKLRLENSDGKLLDKATWDAQDKDSERRIFTIWKHKHGVFKKPKNDLDCIQKESE